MIDIVNVSKSYGDKVVLNGFTAHIDDGGVTAVMGKSGCGKTTLFSIILKTVNADSGTVDLHGAKAGAVFQEDRLLENRNPVDNLLFVAHGGKREKAKELLSSLGLSDSLTLACSRLSGGMRRRVALARALFSEPDILLLDEPFNALDEETKRVMLSTVAHYAQSHTVLLITHNISESEALSARIIYM